MGAIVPVEAEQLKKLLADLEAIDSALGVFDPTIVAETIKPKAIRPSSDWASYGQNSRIALNRAADHVRSRQGPGMFMLWEIKR